MKIETILISEGNTFNNTMTAEIKNNKLTYIENGIKVEYDLDKDTLHRSSDAFDMNYNFILNKETVNEIYIKDIGKSVDIKLITLDLQKDDKKIDITYRLTDDDNTIRYIINYGG